MCTGLSKLQIPVEERKAEEDELEEDPTFCEVCLLCCDWPCQLTALQNRTNKYSNKNCNQRVVLGLVRDKSLEGTLITEVIYR